MYGAILGDIIGSVYEFTINNIKTKEFNLFSEKSHFTDDTVMTIAVAEVMIEDDIGKMSEDNLKDKLISSLQKWGRKYPWAGYGMRFVGWLTSNNPKPYNSFGNGSAMRVSSVGWLFDNIETTRKMAKLTAEITHNHSEGIKGAESIAAAIYFARKGYSKDFIKNYIINEFGYDFSRNCDEIRVNYIHIESCQETVPEALTAFFEGNSFIDVIRTAVSLGGDCDTLTCIAGSVAEAFYGIDDELKKECVKRLPSNLAEVLFRFKSKIQTQ